MRNRSIAFFLLATLFTPNWSYAYPIPPRSLRQLYIDSELVVVADVKKTEAGDREDDWSSGKATLQISSCLKGKTKNKSIVVYYAAGVFCPAPARYETGETVLAFLKSREKGGGYRTYALSYGAKALTKSELGFYLARIKELKNILVIKEEGERLKETTAWLVKCAENEATRQEGLLDLDGPSRYYSTKEKKPEPKFLKYLNEDQKNRLVAILESAKPGKDGMPYDILTVMSILSKTTEDEELLRIVERYRKIDWKDKKKEEKQKTLIADFVMKCKDLPNKAIDSDKK